MFRPALLAIVVSGCGLLGKRVSGEDCREWDKHYREALEETAKEILNKCKDEPVAKAYLKDLDDNISHNADAMKTGCQGMIGVAKYTSEEAKCFVRASDASTWGDCETKPTSALNLYVKTGDAWVKSMKGLCKGSGDADDASKKKKKKKSKDDDE